MNRSVLAVTILIIAALLVAACDWDPLGLGNMNIKVEPELGPETLARVDEVNRILATGVEIGPETRDLIRELNSTLQNGAKVGFDDATLERVDRLLAQVERGIGIEVGLAPDTLASVNRLLDDIDEAPDQWQSVAEQIIKTLEGSAGNVAKEMATQIKSVLADARINLQQLMAAAGTEMRCNVDFLGSRAGATLTEFMGRSIIGQLHDIIEGKKSTTKAVPIPWVCQIIPDQIDLKASGAKLVAERPVVILTGYNFMDSNNPQAYLANEAGQAVETVKIYPYRQSSYQIQLNLQEIDFSILPPRSRVVFKWPNVPDTTALALLLPAPGITPTPGAEMTITTARTNVYIGPGVKYNLLGVAENGAKYPVTGRNGDSSWFQIQYDKKTGWVAASAGRRNEIAVPVVSIPLPPPTANFKAEGPRGPAPLEVDFTDLSTDAPSRWKWEFGDGATASEQNPSHKYTAAGSYTVKLTASNAQGSDSKTMTALVVVLTPAPGPVAGFTASPRSGYAPLSVHFYGSSSGTPTSWKWNFGDGKSATERNPTHTYDNPGRYTVSLTVKDARGLENTRTVSEYIIVSTRPSITPLPPSTKFKIDITTGDVNYAGTDANVYITLFGDRANSSETKLDTSGHDDFERNSTGTYNLFASQNLGSITQIRIRHDNSGSASGWFLERIVITNLDTGKRWTFNAHRWLATDEADHAIDITIRPN